MRDVCNDALEGFKDERVAEGAKNATINRSLEVVRTVLNRAARVWRSHGKPWLSSSPLIEVHNDAVEDLRRIRVSDPVAFGRLFALIEQLRADVTLAPRQRS